MWDKFLDFFCLEIFGPKVFEIYKSGAYMEDVEPRANGVRPAPWVRPHEIKIWCITKSATLFGSQNARHLPSWQNDFLQYATKALLKFYWALADAHEEGAEFSQGVRKGPRGEAMAIVSTKIAALNPLSQLFRPVE